MRDPHIHVERTPIPEFGHLAMQDLITSATGLNTGLPKTVGTGCGRRRPIEMTSFTPEMVTCLACREYAHDLYLNSIKMTKTAIACFDVFQATGSTQTLDDLAALVQEDAEMAARYASA